MKTKLNIALEGTCNGDVVGGYRCNRGNPLSAFVWKGWAFGLSLTLNKKAPGLGQTRGEGGRFS